MNLNQKPIRARDLGIPFEGQTGKYNAITDVKGVLVGHTTLIEDDGDLRVGYGPVRTGVTVILPRGKTYDPVFAAWYSLNGNGEMTGTTWIEESGFLEGPIALTNTHSVGLVRDAIVAWQNQNKLVDPIAPGAYWIMPVVAETYDGSLNDINGQHVKSEHVFSALENAKSGIVAEGSIGSGTGMICHGFKGGIGTASRKLADTDGAYTVAVLVQANHGSQSELTIAGVPLAAHLTKKGTEIKSEVPFGAGSIIVVVTTNAPLLPHQLKRLVRRVPMGLARVGSHGSHYSGDIFIAFSTANSGAAKRQGLSSLTMMPNDEMNPLFNATVQATEEAIVNALIAAKTLTGINGNTAYALPRERVQEILRQYGRLVE